MARSGLLSCAAAGIITSTIAATAIAGATIYECRDDQGRPHFTDTGCPNQSVGVEVRTGPVRAIPFTQIDAAEQKRLAALEADWRKRAQQQRARKQRAQQAWTRRAAERETRCKAAKNNLDALHADRRRGYRLQEAQRLDAEEAALKREIRSACS